LQGNKIARNGIWEEMKFARNGICKETVLQVRRSCHERSC